MGITGINSDDKGEPNSDDFDPTGSQFEDFQNSCVTAPTRVSDSLILASNAAAGASEEEAAAAP